MNFKAEAFVAVCFTSGLIIMSQHFFLQQVHLDIPMQVQAKQPAAFHFCHTLHGHIPEEELGYR